MIKAVLITSAAFCFTGCEAAAKIEAATNIEISNPEKLQGTWSVLRVNLLSDRISKEIIQEMAHLSFDSAKLDNTTKVTARRCSDIIGGVYKYPEPLKCSDEQIELLEAEFGSLFSDVKALLIERGGGLLRIVDTEDEELALLWRVGMKKLPPEDNPVWKALAPIAADRSNYWRLIEMKGLDEKAEDYFSNDTDSELEKYRSQLDPYSTVRLKLSPYSKSGFYSMDMNSSAYLCSQRLVFDKRETGLSYRKNSSKSYGCEQWADKNLREIFDFAYQQLMTNHYTEVMKTTKSVELSETEDHLTLRGKDRDVLATFKLEKGPAQKATDLEKAQ